jgi:membrane dipeptidase
MSDDRAREAFPGLTDIHAHPAMNAWLWNRKLRRHYFTGRTFNPLASLTDFKMLQKGGVKVLWSSLHVPEQELFECRLLRLLAHVFPSGRKLLKRTTWECLLLMMNELEQQVSESADFAVARSNAELDAVLAAGQTAFVHTVEGGYVLGAGLAADDLDERLARLDQLAERGVASLTLAHFFPNELAGQAEAIPAAQRSGPVCAIDTHVDLSRGLTATGRAVVERMVELRMVPDVAHCTPTARREIYELVANRIPVIASHNGVVSMNPEPYNLDEQDMRAIAASGGVAGVIFMPYWLEASDPGPGLDAIWRTLDTMRTWSGGSWEHVAIGTDFDGFTDPPDDCDSAAKLPLIRELLDANRLTAREADAVLGGNARRVLRAGWS